jgi:hypothetical protein
MSGEADHVVLRAVAQELSERNLSQDT